MEHDEEPINALCRTANMVDVFAVLIYKHDPMSLQSPDPLEYESEALSITARFIESGVHAANDDVAVPAAVEIVRNAFIFWFEDDDAALSARAKGADYGPLAKELVEALRTEFVEEFAELDEESPTGVQAEFAAAVGLNVEFPLSERTTPGTPRAKVVAEDNMDLDGPPIIIREKK